MRQEQESGSNSHYLDPDRIVEDIGRATFLSEEWHEGFQRLDQFSATLTRKREQRGGYPWYVWVSLAGAFAMVGGLGWITEAVFDGKIVFSSSFARTAAPVSAEDGKSIQPVPPIPTPQQRSLVDQILWANPTIIGEFKSKVADIDGADIFRSLELYVNEGAKLRRQVLYGQITGKSEGKLEEAYDFWKNLLGYEVFEKGIKIAVEEHKVGDIVIVEDYVPPKGIFLRKDPSLRYDPGRDPFTYQGDNLRIGRGPVDLIDEQRREAWRMWNVEQVGWYGRTSGWQPTRRHQGGWIWQEWLGPKHWLYEPPVR